MRRQVFFVTGTDTGVGKTTVAAALLRRAALQGHASLGLKPVASGCTLDPQGERISDDAQILMAASSVALDVTQVCPFRLLQPWSAHLAAADEGRSLQAARIVGMLRGSLTAGSHVLIEGAGGWRVPINARETLADVARQLQVPVLLVVGVRLGCLNHALLTAEAIVRDGLTLAGFYAVQLEPQSGLLEAGGFVAQVQSLVERLDAPCLGQLPYVAMNPACAEAGIARARDQAGRVRWPGEPADSSC